jgi:hypothetical protein
VGEGRWEEVWLERKSGNLKGKKVQSDVKWKGEYERATLSK